MARAKAASYPTKAIIERTVAAVKAAGIKVGSVKIGPDGSVVCLPAGAESTSAYDAWKASQVD